MTEEIWQNLPHDGVSITQASWPVVKQEYIFDQQSQDMKLLMDIIRAVRNIRAEVNTPMSKKVPMYISAKDQVTLAVLEANKAYIEKFCNPETLTLSENSQPTVKTMSAVVSGAELFLPLEGLIDVTAEIERLTHELEKWDKEVKRVQGKLSNERFVSKAPEAVVAAERAKEADYLEKFATVEKRITELKNM